MANVSLFVANNTEVTEQSELATTRACWSCRLEDSLVFFVR